jgi:hypothetical protein
MGIYDAELRYFRNNRKFSEDFDELGFKLVSKPKYYQFEIISANEYSFEVRAWGNIDEDDKLDIWTVTDDAREPVRIYDDVSDKGKEVDPLKP